eukprot:364340-Chlamydomonas_euryale.AAC.5
MTIVTPPPKPPRPRGTRLEQCPSPGRAHQPGCAHPQGMPTSTYNLMANMWGGGATVGRNYVHPYVRKYTPCPFCDTPLSCCAQHRHTLCGSTPCYADCDCGLLWQQRASQPSMPACPRQRRY